MDTPEGLRATGSMLWREITSIFDLDAAEVRLLVELCRVHDELDDMNAALAGADLLVEGSRGQQRPNPLLHEIREHRRTAERLTNALAIPLPGESVGVRRTAGAKASARRRLASAKKVV